ncbi:MAG: hypothetical protein RLZZ293_1362 [Pseudomonadota bacterium]|jgi:hypothetical protein
MKQSLILITLLGLTSVSSVEAISLKKINNNTFSDSSLNTITYPCSYGGTPLVIYGDDTPRK